MKKILLITLTLFLFFTKFTMAQDSMAKSPFPDDLVNKSDLVFEGRGISYKCFWTKTSSRIASTEKILVLKEFKGTFISDTIEVELLGGKLLINDEYQGEGHIVGIGSEAIFFVGRMDKTLGDLVDYDTTVHWVNGFIGINCQKYGTPSSGLGYRFYDIEKEVYQHLERLTGVKRKVLRKNCREK